MKTLIDKFKKNLYVTFFEKEGGDLIFSSLYVCVLLLLLNIIILCKNINGVLAQFSFISLLFWIIFFITVVRFKKYKLFSYIYVLFINFLFVPAYFFLEDNIFSGIELFFCYGIIITFFLIKTKIVYVFAIIEFIWYSSLILFTAFSAINISNKQIRNNLGDAFILAATAPVCFLVYLTNLYYVEKDKADKANNMLEMVINNKYRFLTNMTNAIRTPINSIIGINELIVNENVGPVIREMDGHIIDSSKHLLKIVNNILEFSKLESGKMTLYPQKYNFKELIENVIDVVSNEYGDISSSSFKVSVDPEIPIYLLGDRARIRQVLLYILFLHINNKNNYKRVLKISGKKNPLNNSILLTCQISISDNDILHKDEIDIFSSDLNYNSRSDSEYTGLALEMAICKHILECMDGGIESKYVEGLGTSVILWFENYIICNQDIAAIENNDDVLALVYADAKEAQEEWLDITKEFNISLRFANGPNALKKCIEERKYTHIFIPSEYFDIVKEIINNYNCESYTYVLTDRNNIYTDFGDCKIIQYPITSLNISDALNGIWENKKYKLTLSNDSIIYPKAKVLIVDDSVVNLKVLKGVMKSFEISPDMAKNADEALELINNNFYDLMIIDQMMPGTDGIELLHIIRELSNTNSKVPIICATADFGNELSRRLRAEGFQDYLAKPVQQYHLARVLRKFLPLELAESSIEDLPGNSNNETESESNIEEVLFVDFEKGKESLGGDFDGYAAVLNTYYKEGLRKLSDIKEEYQKDDLALYVIDVHALKSSSAGIGANGISALFKELEFAGREKKIDIVNNKTDNTLNLFEKVLEQVKDYLVNNNAFESADDKQQDIELEDLSKDYVLEMQDALNKINLKRCEEIINDLGSRNFGENLNAMIKNIKQSYEMFDYHKVKVLISDLLGII